MITFIIAGSYEEFQAFVRRTGRATRDCRYVGSIASSDGIRRSETLLLTGTWSTREDKCKLVEHLRGRGYRLVDDAS